MGSEWYYLIEPCDKIDSDFLTSHCICSTHCLRHSIQSWYDPWLKQEQIMLINMWPLLWVLKESNSKDSLNKKKYVFLELVMGQRQDPSSMGNNGTAWLLFLLKTFFWFPNSWNFWDPIPDKVFTACQHILNTGSDFRFKTIFCFVSPAHSTYMYFKEAHQDLSIAY